jgi:hypothetical protein
MIWPVSAGQSRRLTSGGKAETQLANDFKGKAIVAHTKIDCVGEIYTPAMHTQWVELENCPWVGILEFGV